MTILYAFILGIVEGVTEFLPISSTAHLLFTSKLLHIEQTAFTTFFEVFIQSGAILAVVILFHKKILHHTSLILNLCASFIPTAIVGLLLHKTIKTVFFQSTDLIVYVFLIVGFIFIALEILIKKNKFELHKNIEEMTLQNALIIGMFQSLAVMPGVSRAGAVIIAMMLLKFSRRDAAIYSFLLAIPTIFVATIFDFIKTDYSIFSQQDSSILLLIMGFVISFACALLVMRWLIGYLQKNTLIPFGAYRILLSLILVLHP